jgi:methionyl-tRNA synthetase
LLCTKPPASATILPGGATYTPYVRTPEEERKQAADHSSEEKKRPSVEEPMLYCPVCSQRLTQNHCKLVCEKCGYFMSCADYY